MYNVYFCICARVASTTLATTTSVTKVIMFATTRLCFNDNVIVIIVKLYMVNKQRHAVFAFDDKWKCHAVFALDDKTEVEMHEGVTKAASGSSAASGCSQHATLRSPDVAQTDCGIEEMLLNSIQDKSTVNAHDQELK